MEGEDKIIIPTYDKVWHVEKKIYAIQNLKLPVPVNPYQAGYFFLTAFAFLFLGKVITILQMIPVVVRFIALPYLLSNYLMKKKLDGKNPIKFFLDYMRYLIQDKGSYMERFGQYYKKKEQLTLHWNCSKGKRKKRKKHVSVSH